MSVAVIAGVGPGTGYAVAKAFSQLFPVALLARSQETLDKLANEINAEGGTAKAYATDMSDAASVARSFKALLSDFDNAAVRVAVYNVGGHFKRAPLLEQTTEDVDRALSLEGRGAFIFAQHSVKSMLSVPLSAGAETKKGTLIFTGATASLKGSAQFSSFAMGKFALRALAQSLARELGPQGIHVAHAIVDGIIDTERTRAWSNDSSIPHNRLSPGAIAQQYVNLHNQHPSCWTHELDLRPWSEKF
ncbi:hypothetical protein PYCC9005_004977 [Savitreella phatthalungensis]